MGHEACGLFSLLCHGECPSKNKRTFIKMPEKTFLVPPQDCQKSIPIFILYHKLMSQSIKWICFLEQNLSCRNKLVYSRQCKCQRKQHINIRLNLLWSYKRLKYNPNIMCMYIQYSSKFQT